MSQRRFVNSQSKPMSVSKRSSAICECVRYILYREGSKIPIKRADISKHLSSTCELESNEITAVIAEAEKELKNIYGYSLAKVDTKGVTQYMVVLKDPCEDSVPTPLEEPKEYALLNAALAHIFMSGGSVKDEDLWKFLIKAGLMEENDGVIPKLFTRKFTSQSYITCSKKDGDSLARTTFQWGPRAHKEASKMFMLQKVAEALGQEPGFWCEQYKDASSEANNSAVVTKS